MDAAPDAGKLNLSGWEIAAFGGVIERGPADAVGLRPAREGSLPRRRRRVDAVCPRILVDDRLQPVGEAGLDLVVVLAEPVVHAVPARDEHVLGMRHVKPCAERSAVGLGELIRPIRAGLDAVALGLRQRLFEGLGVSADSEPVLRRHLRLDGLGLAPFRGVAPLGLSFLLPRRIPAAEVFCLLGGVEIRSHLHRLHNVVYCGDFLPQMGDAFEEQFALPGQVRELVQARIVEQLGDLRQGHAGFPVQAHALDALHVLPGVQPVAGPRTPARRHQADSVPVVERANADAHKVGDLAHGQLLHVLSHGSSFQPHVA